MDSRRAPAPGLASALEREPLSRVQAASATHPGGVSKVSSLASRFESTPTAKITAPSTSSSSTATSATVTKVSSIAHHFSTNNNESMPMPLSGKPVASTTNPSLRSAPSLSATTRGAGGGDDADADAASARMREAEAPAPSRVASAAAVFSNAVSKGNDALQMGTFAAAQSAFRNAEINDAAQISKVKAAALKFGRPDGIESAPVIRRQGLPRDAALQRDGPVVERKKSVLEVAGVFEPNSVTTKSAVLESNASVKEVTASVAEVKSVFDGAAQARNHVGKSEEGEQKSVRERFEGAARMFGGSV